ncbi:MAG: hypothetical protein QXI16_02625 [Sulfolobaceae archaeon]
MKLECTNPNYLTINVDRSSRTYKKVSFVSREVFEAYEPSDKMLLYKTRCNKCLACRIYKGYEWSNRLMAEAENWKYVYFLTLTFSDSNYYKINFQKPLREAQLFIKRLRKKFKGLKFKYYLIGELGENTLRYHYHLILYSQEHIFYDMTKFKKTKNGILYISNILDKLWSNGMHTIAFAEQNSMRYVANYVQVNDNVISRSMSNGIGFDYINEKKTDGTYLIAGKFSPVPRSIRDKFDLNSKIKQAKELHEYQLIFNTTDETKKSNDRLLRKKLYRK